MPDLSAMQPWMWLVLGLALVGIEILAPGLFLFWLGLAAGVTALVAFLFDFSWQVEWTVFAVLALVLLGVGRTLSKAKGQGDAPMLNERGNSLIGREFSLAEPIANGFGTVRIDDSVWRVSGADAARGAKVRVVGVDGATLRVVML
jgi:inner membrane protein